MKATSIIAIMFTVLFFIGCKQEKKENSDLIIIGAGKMPNLARVAARNFYVVYGTGDSIVSTASNDKGQTFSSPKRH